MPDDPSKTIPVLIHVYPDDWKLFKELCGKRRVSRRVREIVRQEVKRG